MGNGAPRDGARYVAGTIVARNYVGFARVLERSLVAAHPEIDFVTLVIDGAEDDRGSLGLAEVLLMDDLGLAPEVLEPMLVMYGVTELATAVKPALLQALLRRGYDAAAYFDPDILIRDDLTDVFDRAAAEGIVLTPHTRVPVPRDGLEISERVIMQAGIFNLGFIAVGSGAGEFLAWWHERLRTDAVIDFENALFTDQRWIDWVPALFPVEILRDPGLNAAYWNLHERPLTRDEDGRLLAGGAPLRFVHFSGFDIATPWVLSRFTREIPRVMVSENPLLRELCEGYANALVDAGHLENRGVGYGLEKVPGGPVLTPEVRRVYRDSLVGLLPFPDAPVRPLSEPEAFRGWLSRRVWTSPWSGLSPAEYALWRTRGDLHAAFPTPFGASGLTFRRWLDGEPSVGEHYRNLGLEAPRPVEEAPADDGWSLVVGGWPRLGGQVQAVAERIAADLARAGSAVSLHVPDDPGEGRDATWHRTDLSGAGEHANRIVCIDADQLVEDRLTQMIGDPQGVCIGVWISSEPNLDDPGRHALELFDEVWVVTGRAEAAIRDAVARPVHRIYPPPAAGPAAEGQAGHRVIDRVRATGPVVLVELDARADHERQNPEAAIEAYRSAFAESDDARLVVDIRYAEPSRRQVEALRHAAGARPDVVLLTPSSRPEPAASLVPHVDAVLSLPRTDAVGLPVLTAIETGVPVVACDFAGAVDLLGPSDAVVPGRVVQRPGRRPSVWAEPDIDAAAERLRTVWREADRARDAAAQERARLSDGPETPRDRVAAWAARSGVPHPERAQAVSLRRTLVSDHEGLGRVRSLRAQVAALEQQLADARRGRLARYLRRLRRLVAPRR